MRITNIITEAAHRTRVRLAAEHGFTMLIALGVLSVTTLLAGAAYVAVLGDTHASRHDLDAKRAYAAAGAGVNDYLYQLNQDPDYWKTCTPNDLQTITGVPGATKTSVQYSFQYILANGSTSCSTSDPITSLIDTPTGMLQMKFIGYSGAPTTGNPACPYTACRGIIASFRKDSPIDYLWYTVYEAFDPKISGYNDCQVFYRVGRPAHCDIFWGSGDTMNGPMYTQDQYLIGGSPTFGRTKADNIASVAQQGSSWQAICGGNNCGSLNLQGTAITGARIISPPADNSQLLTDAQNHGQVYLGTTTITLNGTNTASVVNCPNTNAGTPTNNGCTTSSLDISAKPIIYVQNAAGCSPPPYSPYDVSYPTTILNSYYYGCAGDVYIQGSYNNSLTIAAANNIIVTGDLTTSHDGAGLPNGVAVMGLVANGFVRVMHGVTPRQNHTSQQCQAASGGNVTNIANQTLTNPTIDAAILAVAHSWIVDNFDCGARLQNLTVNGAIAQYSRGPVAITGTTGYLKHYTYDNRLHVTLPPYLFDIANSGWHVVRETLCVPGGSGATGC